MRPDRNCSFCQPLIALSDFSLLNQGHCIGVISSMSELQYIFYFSCLFSLDGAFRKLEAGAIWKCTSSIDIEILDWVQAARLVGSKYRWPETLKVTWATHESEFFQLGASVGLKKLKTNVAYCTYTVPVAFSFFFHLILGRINSTKRFLVLILIGTRLEPRGVVFEAYVACVWRACIVHALCVWAYIVKLATGKISK